MANENKDLIRVCTTQALMTATLREKMIGLETDTFKLAAKAPGGTLYEYRSGGIVPDGEWTGLGAAKGRFVFDDEALDTITVKSASLLGEDYFQIGQDVDNADFAALILKNTNDPLTTEVGQSVSINAYLRKSTDGGSNYTDEQAGQIVFGKDSDFFHATTEADCDGNIQFKVAVDGTLTERLRIGSAGIGIGTATPAGELEMAKAAIYQQLIMSDYSDALADCNYLVVRKSGSDTLGTLAHTHDNTMIFELTCQGVKSNDSAFATGAKMWVKAVGDAGAAYVGAKICFGTGTNAAAVTERLSIGDAGQITLGLPDTADAVPLLRVWGETAGGSCDSPAGAIATFEDNTTCFAQFLAPNTYRMGIQAGTPTDVDSGSILYYPDSTVASSYWQFTTGAILSMKTLSTGMMINNEGVTGGQAGVLDIAQEAASSALPVVNLRQDDNTEPFIRLEGATGVAAVGKSLVDKDGYTTLGTAIGCFMVEVNDSNNQITDGDYYVALYSPTFTCHP